MTTGTSPEPLDRIRRWAREQLDLPPDMSDEQSRRALLQRLAELDFMPPIGWDSALRVAGFAPCGDVNGRAFAPARRAVEETLRAEVEAFASVFFSLRPEARSARFQELLTACVDLPCLRARVESLRPGLDLPCNLPVDQSPEVNELLTQARRLFVLRPQERASRRMKWLRECQGDIRKWQRAASFVQSRIGRYAALELVMFRELANAGMRERLRKKVARKRKRAAGARGVITGLKWLNHHPGIAVFLMMLTCGTLGVLSGGARNSDHTLHQPPVQPFGARKANQQLNEWINKSVRDGQPIPEALRRLYGLPAEQTPSKRPRTLESPTATGPTPPAAEMERSRELMRRFDQPSDNANVP